MRQIYLSCTCICLAVCSLIFLDTSLNAQSTIPAESERAFLSANVLLKGWEAKYGSIHSSYGSVIEHLTDFKKSKDVKKIAALFLEPVVWQYIDRTAAGDRYHVRYSTDTKGFVKEDSIQETAFDGKQYMEYRGSEKKGRIVPGRIDKDQENIIGRYLLMEPVDSSVAAHPQYLLCLFRDYPAGSLKLETRVRAKLETVNGQRCHVIEWIKEFPGRPDWATQMTVWIAHERGMLPMKSEVLICGHRRGTEMDEIAMAHTDTGDFWYPTKAHRYETIPDYGTMQFEFSCSRYIPNVLVTDDSFKVKFPKRTRVYDKGLELVYTTEGTEGEETVVYDVRKQMGKPVVGPLGEATSVDEAVRSRSTTNSSDPRNEGRKEKGDTAPYCLESE